MRKNKAQQALAASQTTITLSQKQIRNRKTYLTCIGEGEFSRRTPATFISDQHPGTLVHHSKFENCDCWGISRKDLLDLAVDGILISIDTTYKSAPRNGHVTTIGITQWDSFVPVFVFVANPPQNCKVPQDQAFYEALYRVFAQFIIAFSKKPDWSPRVVTRDHAMAIMNAAIAVWGPEIEGFVCWSHLTTLEDDFFKKNHYSEDRMNDLRNLLRHLHRAESQSDYLLGLAFLERHKHPMWRVYYAWLGLGDHLPGGCNENWVVSMAPVQTAHAQSTVHKVE